MEDAAKAMTDCGAVKQSGSYYLAIDAPYVNLYVKLIFKKITPAGNTRFLRSLSGSQD